MSIPADRSRQPVSTTSLHVVSGGLPGSASRGVSRTVRRGAAVALLAGSALAGLPVATAFADTATAPGTLPGTEAVSTPTRPQLTAEQARTYTIADYLGDWTPYLGDPIGPRGGDPGTRPPLLLVAPGTTYPTVQSAVTAAVAQGGTTRITIAVLPGTYREVVCVPATAPPITLVGLSHDPSRTVIVSGNANPTPKTPGTPANPCNPNLAGATYGTGGSATFAAAAADFRAANLTFLNDYVEGTYTSNNQSAVALSALGDRQVYQNVRAIGNQDTLLANSAGTAVVARQYFRHLYVEGDTDFVFGRATAVFDDSVINYTSARRTDGVIFAPSTAAANPHGFLVVRSRLTVTGPDGGVASGTVRLGRAWDESVGTLTNYVNGTSPNGEVVIRDSSIAAHVLTAAPWGSSTVSRPFCAADCVYSPNRFAEYRNYGPGAAA